MKPKTQRLWFLGLTMTFLMAAALLTANAFRDNLVFFLSPSEIQAKQGQLPAQIRMGGLVKPESIRKDGGKTIYFTVTDMQNDIPVAYEGIIPDLFREGQGVVVEGGMQPDGTFRATRLFAKHDENYMPPEVADSLKKSGYWNHLYGGDKKP